VLKGNRVFAKTGEQKGSQKKKQKKGRGIKRSLGTWGLERSRLKNTVWGGGGGGGETRGNRAEKTREERSTATEDRVEGREIPPTTKREGNEGGEANPKKNTRTMLGGTVQSDTKAAEWRSGQKNQRVEEGGEGAGRADPVQDPTEV